MTVLREIMTDDVVYLTPDDTVKHAAEEMRDLNVGVIPVCNQDRTLLGVITDRDIAMRVVADGRDAGMPLRDAYTANPVTGTRDMDIEDAMMLMMDHQIRRLPIVEKG